MKGQIATSLAMARMGSKLTSISSAKDDNLASRWDALIYDEGLVVTRWCDSAIGRRLAGD